MKKLYFVSLLVFIVMFLLEFIKYIKFPSNTFGLIYLLMDTLVLFILTYACINYRNNNKNIRLSKILIIIIILLFEMLILTKMNYIDTSKDFIKSMKLYLYIIKPIFICMVSTITFLDFKFKNKS